MWAIQHIPSGSWDRGDSNLIFYWVEYEAKLACANEAFKPIKVRVTEE
jgi:hypothetical protein